MFFALSNLYWQFRLSSPTIPFTVVRIETGLLGYLLCLER